MNKIDLEVKIESLRTMVQESQQSASNYTGQLVEMEKQLANVNKVALLPSQFDDIYEAIESGISEFDFNDTENFEIEYGIDYDGRVNCESHEFRNHEDLLQMINDKIQALFKEAELPEAEECESEVHPVEKLQN